MHTHPLPHNEMPQTTRSREGATARAGSRGVSLVDDFHRPAALLRGTQPRLRRAPRLIRQRSFNRLAATRFWAYSTQIRWMVSAPTCAKYSLAPLVNAHKSNPDSHFLFRSVRVAVCYETSLT